MIMLLKVAVFWFQMSREKKQAGYFPLDPGCLMTGCLQWLIKYNTHITGE